MSQPIASQSDASASCRTPHKSLPIATVPKIAAPARVSPFSYASSDGLRVDNMLRLSRNSSRVIDSERFAEERGLHDLKFQASLPIACQDHEPVSPSMPSRFSPVYAPSIGVSVFAALLSEATSGDVACDPTQCHGESAHRIEDSMLAVDKPMPISVKELHDSKPNDDHGAPLGNGTMKDLSSRQPMEDGVTIAGYAAEDGSIYENFPDMGPVVCITPNTLDRLHGTKSTMTASRPESPGHDPLHIADTIQRSQWQSDIFYDNPPDTSLLMSLIEDARKAPPEQRRNGRPPGCICFAVCRCLPVVGDGLDNKRSDRAEPTADKPQKLDWNKSAADLGLAASSDWDGSKRSCQRKRSVKPSMSDDSPQGSNSTSVGHMMDRLQNLGNEHETLGGSGYVTEQLEGFATYFGQPTVRASGVSDGNSASSYGLASLKEAVGPVPPGFAPHRGDVHASNRGRGYLSYPNNLVSDTKHARLPTGAVLGGKRFPMGGPNDFGDDGSPHATYYASLSTRQKNQAGNQSKLSGDVMSHEQTREHIRGCATGLYTGNDDDAFVAEYFSLAGHAPAQVDDANAQDRITPVGPGKNKNIVTSKLDSLFAQDAQLLLGTHAIGGEGGTGVSGLRERFDIRNVVPMQQSSLDYYSRNYSKNVTKNERAAMMMRRQRDMISADEPSIPSSKRDVTGGVVENFAGRGTSVRSAIGEPHPKRIKTQFQPTGVISGTARRANDSKANQSSTSTHLPAYVDKGKAGLSKKGEMMARMYGRGR